MWRPPDPVIENDMSQTTPETSVEMPAGFDPEESAQLRAVAIAAAMAVAPGLKAAFRSKMAVDFKKDLRDIVTEHDRAAEVAITEHLLAAVPQSEVLGEEGACVAAGRCAGMSIPLMARQILPEDCRIGASPLGRLWMARSWRA